VQLAMSSWVRFKCPLVSLDQCGAPDLPPEDLEGRSRRGRGARRPSHRSCSASPFRVWPSGTSGVCGAGGYVSPCPSSEPSPVPSVDADSLGTSPRCRHRLLYQSQVQRASRFDGTEAVETIYFAFEGTEYEVDLCEEKAAHFRKAISEYATPRAVSGRGCGGRRGRGSPSSRKRDTHAIRAWVQEQGYEVSSRVRVSRDIVRGVRSSQVTRLLGRHTRDPAAQSG